MQLYIYILYIFMQYYIQRTVILITFFKFHLINTFFSYRGTRKTQNPFKFDLEERVKEPDLTIYPSWEIEGIARSKVYLPTSKSGGNLEYNFIFCDAPVFMRLRRTKSSQLSHRFASRQVEIQKGGILQSPGTRGTPFLQKTPLLHSFFQIG